MHGKEFWLDCLRTYFVVVTLINVALWVLGMTFFPETTLGYTGFAFPLVYGLAGTLPNVVMYSRRELKIGELVVRKMIQLILIEGCVLFLIFYGIDLKNLDWKLVGSVALSIVVIYIISSLIDFLQNYLAAKQMTEELLKFQEKMTEL